MKKVLLTVAAGLLLAAGAVLAAAVSGPSEAGAADHVDAPGLTPPGGNFQLDIADLYAWRARSGNTVLAMTVNGLTKAKANPVFASGVPGVRATRGVSYWFRVDNDGDAVPDVNLQVTFGKPNAKGVQKMTVRRNGKVLVSGESTRPGAKFQKVSKGNGVKAYAGLRDDPFFFDLAGYLDILTAIDDDTTNNDKSFIGCKAPRADFFKGLNVSAIVLELPPSLLTADDSTAIGVWGATTVGKKQVDRIGRPAISTVFVPNNPFPGEQQGEVRSKKAAYNKGQPKNDQKAFRGEIVNTLGVLFSLNDAAGDDASDDAKQIGDLADILLPDILTFDTAKSDGFLNGRRLADDVIDAELGLITEGLVTTDCVSKNDRKFWPNFPYLATPH